jgi:hypothetical protein
MRWFILVSVALSLGAEYRTPNFQVTAPDAQSAELVGKWAEHHRREGAVQWLGKEMPAWCDPCPLSVTVTMDAPHGKTSFTYQSGRVCKMEMSMSGPLDRLVYSVLPHEITHTILAHHFGCAIPRWADEGAAVLSECEAEQQRHAAMTAILLNNKKHFRLRTLFLMTEYPAKAEEVTALYCQSFAVADYLVKQKDRARFLKLVADGLAAKDWEKAVQTGYGFKSVDDLEENWLKSLAAKAAKDFKTAKAALRGPNHGAYFLRHEPIEQVDFLANARKMPLRVRFDISCSNFEFVSKFEFRI